MNTLHDDNLNVIVPMAGAGSRFQTAGYDLPKPLIEVLKRPMVQTVVDYLNVQANFIYIVQKEHNEEYALSSLLNSISPNCKVVEVDGLTEGAACSILAAKEHINNENPILIVNSDNLIVWEPVEFMFEMDDEADGGIVVFEVYDSEPKWSYVGLDEFSYITIVAEKDPISNLATAGIYYWKHGRDFVSCAEQMIEKDIRVNNEFYVAPVYNEFIAKGNRIVPFRINQQDMWGLGTPEDLAYFNANFK